MPLSDIIGGRLVSCSPETTVFDCSKLMKSKDVGAVLVLDNDKPVGIITDRDIVLRCVCDGEELTTPVRDIMTKSVAIVRDDDGIQDVVKVMKDKSVRRVPVVDRAGKAIGLLSFGDVFALLAQEMAELSVTTAHHKSVQKAAA